MQKARLSSDKQSTFPQAVQMFSNTIRTLEGFLIGCAVPQTAHNIKQNRTRLSTMRNPSELL